MQKLFKFWFPLVAYSGIIFYVSGLPDLKAPVEGIHVDKILHIGEYIPFGFLAARCWGIHSAVVKPNILFFAGILTVIYGLSDEYHQSFVPGRFASVYDLLADTLGGLIGAWFYLKFQQKQEGKSNKEIED